MNDLTSDPKPATEPHQAFPKLGPAASAPGDTSGKTWVLGDHEDSKETNKRHDPQKAEYTVDDPDDDDDEPPLLSVRLRKQLDEMRASLHDLRSGPKADHDKLHAMHYAIEGLEKQLRTAKEAEGGLDPDDEADLRKEAHELAKHHRDKDKDKDTPKTDPATGTASQPDKMADSFDQHKPTVSG